MTIRRLAALLLLASGAASAPRPAAPAAGRTLYVAPDGDDRATGLAAARAAGSSDGPLRTLEAARDRIRAARRQGRSDAPNRVLLRGGTYPVTEPFVLGPEDSGTEREPVVYAAYPGERPVVSGGRVLTGWSKGPKEVWTVELPEARGAWSFRQLFVNGRRSRRARTPNHGFFRMDGPKADSDPFQFRYRNDEIQPSWVELGDVEVVGLFAWADVRRPIRDVDRGLRIATLAGPALPYNREANARYWVENAPEALDLPGEWYLDRRRGVLSYWPLRGEEMARAEVVAPVATRLVHLRGDAAAGAPVHHVIFRGVTFQDARWELGPAGYADVQAAVEIGGALKLETATDCAIELCTIRRVEGYAIDVGAGCKRIRITGNDVHDIGAGGVKLGWGREGVQAPHIPREYRVDADEAHLNSDNSVTDNHLHNLGNIFPAAIGVWAGQTIGSTIAHNDIHDLAYSAISVGWNWGYGPHQAHHVRIEYNHLHDIGRGLLSDMGAIYTLGIQPGTVIRNNLIHDVARFAYGGWGIYFDEGSTGIVAENNVVYRTDSAGFHQHYGRDNVVRNNVFAFGHEYQVTLSRPEDHRSFTFERNIVVWDEGTLFGGSDWTGGGALPACAACPAGEPRHPEAACRRADIDGNVYFDRRRDPVRFFELPLAAWRERGYDRRSIVADPLFVDAGRYDFSLRRESPALRLGFQPIDLSTVGPRRATLRGLEQERGRTDASPDRAGSARGAEGNAR